MEWLLILMLRHPLAVRFLAWAVFSIASAAIGLGLRLGRVFSRATRALSRVGVDQEFTLANVYPNWPTWWIPETTTGFMTWLVIAVFGVGLAFTAKRLQKQYS
jgi:hypothetical protein